MSKLLKVQEDEQIVGYIFDCPGCEQSHKVYIYPHQNEMGAHWLMTGDEHSPTFSPSILCVVTPQKGKPLVCHSIVEKGKIRFLDDCTHKLAGQTVELPEVD